jgi:EAL domain-containing protein (putative c-di-GMP-specific phosphodiesterase class I)/CHASE2 domain-containing sensor protein
VGGFEEPAELLARIRQRWRLVVVAAAAIAGIVCGLSGTGESLDALLQQQRWKLRSHAAGGQVKIVEIDARSIAAIAHWPWPRSIHARIVDDLTRAGAATIAFDVDFSARSRASEDAALVAALARAGGGVVLPTFRQRSGSGRGGWIDSLPFSGARRQSVLAAVSVQPDADGYVRRMPIATVTRGVTRPSLSAMVAQASGRAGDSFRIDYSIDPQSIPRHSVIDVLEGRVPDGELRGKRLIVGATAIALGDHYAVPRYGVVPGVVIQALAAETLSAGMLRSVSWLFPFLVALLVAAGLLRLRSAKRLAMASAGSAAVLFATSLAAEQWLRAILPLAPALVTIGCAVIASAIARIVADAERRQLFDAESGLPNKAAMLRWLQRNRFEAVVVTRISTFERLAAALGADQMGETIRRLHDRVSLAVDGAPVFRIEVAALAWPATAEHRAMLDERLAALRATMLNPIEVRGRRADVTLHFGVADKAHGSPAQLIAFAGLASERAREAHSGWHVHHGEDNVQLDRELSLLGELDEAVRDGSLKVVYQPKLDLKSNRIVSAEALVRWHHPALGPLGPDAFVPLAERHDRIQPLTGFVMDRAIRDSAAWRAKGHLVSVAVNISSLLVASPEFFEAVSAATQRADFVRDGLIFEVTESAALSDPEKAVEALHAFRAMGIAVSLDDYGTGQSTLSYLQQLPLDELKIDRRFVQHAHLQTADAVLVRSTIDLAHQLKLKVVAEGVEDQACLDFLAAAGCDTIQGYLIGKPMDSDALLARISGLRHAA